MRVLATFSVPLLSQPDKCYTWDECCRECRRQLEEIAAQLRKAGQGPAAETVLRDVEEFLTFYDFPLPARAGGKGAMAFNQLTVEQLTAWCFNAEELATERKKAWAVYFAEDDPRPVKYWRGAEEKNSREWRFLGWFMFDHTLPSGEKPAEVAVKRLYTAGMQDELLKAIAETRYVNAVVSSVIGRSVFLALEDESLELRSPIRGARHPRRKSRGGSCRRTARSRRRWRG